MRKNWIMTTTILGSLLMTSCGSEETSTASGTDVSTTSGAMSVVPSATGEVVSSSSSAIVDSGYQALASTGLVLNTAKTSSFSNGDSTAMCETANLIKNVYREAAHPDNILCYLRSMASAEVIPSNFADGQWHYVKLVNLPDSGGGNSTPFVKLKIEVTSGRVSDFKMYSCFGGTSSSPTQTEYMSQTNNGSTANLVSKYSGSETFDSTSFTFGADVSASGSLNSSGKWLSKTVTARNYSSSSFGSYNMSATITQGTDNVELSGYRKGSFGAGTSFSDSFYTKAQILGASSMNTFALGDGSSKINMNFNDGSSTHTFNNTFSWNGDSFAPLATASDGDYYSDASGGTLPTVPSSTTAVSFSGDEAWDCTLPSGESWIEANFSSGGSTLQTNMQSCDSQFGIGSDWISCSGTDQY